VGTGRDKHRLTGRISDDNIRRSDSFRFKTVLDTAVAILESTFIQYN
jgi:hypothetical protein